MILSLHVVAGGVSLVLGAAALLAAKGARLHRMSGLLFVGSMATMALSGAVIAAFAGDEASVIAGLLAGYLVMTALLTVRRPTLGWERLDVIFMLLALALGVTSLTFGLEALGNGTGRRGGYPAGIYLIFGAVALSSSVSDLRMVRSGGVSGSRRLVRHLWRMCFALFIASGSFFLGQADEIPEPLRIMPVLVVLALAPLGVIPYWVRRVRSRSEPYR